MHNAGGSRLMRRRHYSCSDLLLLLIRGAHLGRELYFKLTKPVAGGAGREIVVILRIPFTSDSEKSLVFDDMALYCFAAGQHGVKISPSETTSHGQVP